MRLIPTLRIWHERNVQGCKKKQLIEATIYSWNYGWWREWRAGGESRTTMVDDRVNFHYPTGVDVSPISEPYVSGWFMYLHQFAVPRGGATGLSGRKCMSFTSRAQRIRKRGCNEWNGRCYFWSTIFWLFLCESQMCWSGGHPQKAIPVYGTTSRIWSITFGGRTLLAKKALTKSM